MDYPWLSRNVSLLQRNTLRIDAKAEYFCSPSTDQELRECFDFIRLNNLPFFILGAGSNVIFADSSYLGAVVWLGRLHVELMQETEDRILLGAGVPVSKAIAWGRTRSIGTLFPWAGIPGTVGGATFMNAGTSMGWADGIVETIRYFDPTDTSFVTQRLDKSMFKYRHQEQVPEGSVICAITCPIRASTNEEIERLDSFIKRRKSTQPIQFPNCGSVFKNPPNNFAGKLVQESGLLGKSQGKAMISPLHGNFIINTSGASGKDILQLIELMTQEVYRQFGVALELEVKIVAQQSFRRL